MSDYPMLGADGRLTDRESKPLELKRDLSSPEVTLRDKTTLVVDVPLSTRRPHDITRQGPEAGIDVRLGSTTRQAAAAHGAREPEGREQKPERHTRPGHTYTHSNDYRYDGRHDVVMMQAAANGPVHRNTLLEATGLKLLSQNYARHVVPLLNRGLLAMTVADKPRSKAQRYILTDEGRAYLRHIMEGSE